MIVVKSNREEIFNFNYWLEHNLTPYDIEKILNSQSLDKEKQKFKIEYEKFQLIEGEKELWFSLKEAAYILNGNSFLIYGESDDNKKRNVSADYVKNKSNDILNNMDELLSERKEDYIKHFGTEGLESYLQRIKPQKKSFALSKMKHINAQMIDEILRVNISRTEKIKFKNLKKEDVLPSKSRITKYINCDSILKNKDSIIEYLNKVSSDLGECLSDSYKFLNNISLLKTMVKEARKDIQNILTNCEGDVQVKYKNIKNEYIKLTEKCNDFSVNTKYIIDIEHIFSICADIQILSIDTDENEIINIPDINNHQQIAEDFKNYVDSIKKQYLMDIEWSKHSIYINLNKIEQEPTTFFNGTMELTRISDWMYRNKTKVAYQIINQNFNDAYDLLNGLLKHEYINIIRILRIWYDKSQKERK